MLVCRVGILEFLLKFVRLVCVQTCFIHKILELFSFGLRFFLNLFVHGFFSVTLGEVNKSLDSRLHGNDIALRPPEAGKTALRE